MRGGGTAGAAALDSLAAQITRISTAANAASTDKRLDRMTASFDFSAEAYMGGSGCFHKLPGRSLVVSHLAFVQPTTARTQQVATPPERRRSQKSPLSTS